MSKTAYIDSKAFEIKDGETMLSFIRRYKEKNLVPTVLTMDILKLNLLTE